MRTLTGCVHILECRCRRSPVLQRRQSTEWRDDEREQVQSGGTTKESEAVPAGEGKKGESSEMKSEDKVQEGRRAEGIWEKKVWGARIKALEDALVSKSDELRVTKESVDTKQSFRISELESEVSLLRGRIKSLHHQLDMNKKTAGSRQAVNGDDEGLDERYEIPKGQLEQCQLLGNGAFAEVYQGWWRKPVAIKKFRRVSRQDQLDSFARETKILRLMHHSGIPYFW